MTTQPSFSPQLWADRVFISAGYLCSPEGSSATALQRASSKAGLDSTATGELLPDDQLAAAESAADATSHSRQDPMSEVRRDSNWRSSEKASTRRCAAATATSSVRPLVRCAEVEGCACVGVAPRPW